MTETKRSIIIIDDDKFLLDMYSKKFSDEGYCVESCSFVHDAVAILEGGAKIDAIVFDLVMPQEDGFDLLRSLKEKDLGKDAVKVVLTNQGAEEEEEKTRKLGADAYIIKATMIPSEVFNTINTLVLHGKKA